MRRGVSCPALPSIAMRILFLSHYFKPEGNAPASRAYEMCRRWVAEGHQVTVITSAPNVPDGRVYEGYQNKLFQRENIDGIDVVRVWTYLAPNKGSVKRILNYLSYMASSIVMAGLRVERPDVLVATSPQFFNGWAGVILSRLRRLPFVLEIRDIWPESIGAVGAMGSRQAFAFLEVLERRMYAAADHIITVGNGYRTQLMRRGVPGGKISIVTNGADLDEWRPREKPWKLKQRYNLNGEFVCMYGGTIGMACGLDVVIAAAEMAAKRKDDHLKFLLVGDGAERERLQAEAASRGLYNVIFTGRVPKEEMPDHLALADVCLVHLKAKELFKSVLPSKIFEAAAMKRPILNGVLGEAAALVERAGAGVTFQPENPYQLLNALQSLRSNRQLCNRLGEQGRDYVAANFNRDVLAHQYLDVLARVANAQPVAQVAPRPTTVGS